jgi:hypothetical protein
MLLLAGFVEESAAIYTNCPHGTIFPTKLVGFGFFFIYITTNTHTLFLFFNVGLLTLPVARSGENPLVCVRGPA